MEVGNKEDKLLISRAQDALRMAEKRCMVKALGFLNPRQRGLLQRELHPPMDVEMEFCGGYDQAERTLLICRPDFLEADPGEFLCALEIQGRQLSGLSHRDYLGSLMGLGITRENIGDILVLEGCALIFGKTEIAGYICGNLEKIGRCGVTVTCRDLQEITVPARELKEIKGTVASLRLDSVLALGAGISRSAAAGLLASDKVSLNWEPIRDGAKPVKVGDLFSVRGFGRMELAQVSGMTRKNRYSITLWRYV